MTYVQFTSILVFTICRLLHSMQSFGKNRTIYICSTLCIYSQVDIDNNHAMMQMCNMQRQKIMGLITVSHANVKIYHTKYYIYNPVRPPMC